jgi:Tfp pilus assembly protein PilF
VLEDTLKLILSLPGRKPARSLARQLDGLFAALGRTTGAPEASRIETLIWAAWMSHDDPVAEEALERATRAIAAHDHPEAEALLDDLVAAHPEYAEAWNKRATLHFRMGRDEESVADIRRTLALEPRHFGAICGFGQICLRHGNRPAAMFAFDAALRINPSLGAVRTVFEELAAESARTAH